jgi:hypothetical protein
MTDTGVEKGDAGFPCAPLFNLFCVYGWFCFCVAYVMFLGVIVYFSFFSVTSQAVRKS